MGLGKLKEGEMHVSHVTEERPENIGGTRPVKPINGFEYVHQEEEHFRKHLCCPSGVDVCYIRNGFAGADIPHATVDELQATGVGKASDGSSDGENERAKGSLRAILSCIAFGRSAGL